MALVLVALEIPDEALFSLRKLRRNLPSVLWFDPLDDGEVLAPLRRSWFDEWGYRPLVRSSCDDAEVEALDRELQRVRLPAISFTISRLTFLADPDPFRICACVDVSPALERLIDACAKAVDRANVAAREPGFEPLLPLADCYGASREDLTDYSSEVEPFAPITIRCDRFLLCSKATGPMAGSIETRVKVDYEYRLG